MHVNIHGEVDKWATRGEAIGYFVILGAGLLVVAVAMVCMCRFVPTRLLNIPNKAYWTTPEREPTVRKMMVWDMAVIFSMPFLALAFIPVQIALTSDRPEETSALWIVLPIGLWLLAMAGFVIWMITRRYRAGTGGGL